MKKTFASTSSPGGTAGRHQTVDPGHLARAQSDGEGPQGSSEPRLARTVPWGGVAGLADVFFGCFCLLVFCCYFFWLLFVDFCFNGCFWFFGLFFVGLMQGGEMPSDGVKCFFVFRMVISSFLSPWPKESLGVVNHHENMAI